MAILQVNVGIQSAQELVGHLSIDVEVGLLRLVVVVFVVRHQSINRILHPCYQTVVVTFILVPSASQYSLQVALVVILNRSHSTIEVVSHLLLAHQVAAGPCHFGVQVVLKQGALALVFLVIAITSGIVQGCVEVQYIVQALVPYQLVVLLMVVVRLVVVIARVPLFVVILATRVIGTSKEALLIFRRVVPCMVGLFHAIEGDEFHHRVLAKVACLQEVGVQLGGGTVQITLRADV